jgi:hypothetical protein
MYSMNKVIDNLIHISWRINKSDKRLEHMQSLAIARLVIYIYSLHGHQMWEGGREGYLTAKVVDSSESKNETSTSECFIDGKM